MYKKFISPMPKTARISHPLGRPFVAVVPQRDVEGVLKGRERGGVRHEHAGVNGVDARERNAGFASKTALTQTALIGDLPQGGRESGDRGDVRGCAVNEWSGGPCAVVGDVRGGRVTVGTRHETHCAGQSHPSVTTDIWKRHPEILVNAVVIACIPSHRQTAVAK